MRAYFLSVESLNDFKTSSMACSAECCSSIAGMGNSCGCPMCWLLNASMIGVSCSVGSTDANPEMGAQLWDREMVRWTSNTLRNVIQIWEIDGISMVGSESNVLMLSMSSLSESSSESDSMPISSSLSSSISCPRMLCCDELENRYFRLDLPRCFDLRRRRSCSGSYAIPDS